MFFLYTGEMRLVQIYINLLYVPCPILIAQADGENKNVYRMHN